MLRGLISPTKTRARIYDRDGVPLLDSRTLYGRGECCVSRPAAARAREKAFRLRRADDDRGSQLACNWRLRFYHELGPENGKGYYEVEQ
ncbi:MAG: stimulus-sensing domain-containing protein [Xanthobacteraceae bacterium]